MPLKRKVKETSEVSSDQVVKTKKRRKATRNDFARDETLNLDLGLNTAIGRLDNQLLADLIAQKVKNANPDLSIVELEERRVPGTSISRNKPTEY